MNPGSFCVLGEEGVFVRMNNNDERHWVVPGGHVLGDGRQQARLGLRRRASSSQRSQ